MDMAQNEPGTHPPLTRSDAWLLAALTEGSHDGRPVNLRDFVNDADWLNRLIRATSMDRSRARLWRARPSAAPTTGIRR